MHEAFREPNGFFDGVGAYPTRFAPIKDVAGRYVPVLYAGPEQPGALFESIFHSVPRTGFRSLQAAVLDARVLGHLELLTDLRLADLTGLGIGSLGATRVELIESEASHYNETVTWAEAIHQDNPDIQGLYWTSRQNDRFRAVMLFGDRVPETVLRQVDPGLELWHDDGIRLVAHWADRADIALV